MQTILLLFISILPIFLIGLYIYKKDRLKEPPKLLTKLFIGGMLSCVAVVLITILLESVFPWFGSDVSTLNLVELIVYVFIGIALIEELCKWVVVYFFSYKHKSFDQVYDMIVYSVFVALGFAVVENILYVLSGGIQVGIVRAISAVPAHACDGIFMGYYLALAKLSSFNGRADLSKKYLVLSLIFPVILHGIYDYCLFSGNLFFILIFFIFVVFLYIHALKRVKRFAAISNKMTNQNHYCPTCGRLADGNYCGGCGNKIEYNE